MSKKENLFLLIKSLSKAEKRYFRLFAANTKSDKQKNNNYLLLFDAIDKQAIYDEQAIKKRFTGQAFVKQLHVTKNYLSQLILKSLRNFHSKLSKETELRDLLRDVEILFHKELYSQCRDLLNKAHHLATRYEYLTILLDINRWKRRVYLATSASINSRPSLNELLKENNTHLQKLTHQQHYWDWTINLFDYLKSVNDNQEAFLETEWFKDSTKADTIQAKKLYHHVLMGYYIMAERNYDKAIETIDNLITLLEAHPKHIAEDISSYLTALNNKAGLLLELRLYEQIPPLFQTIRNASQKYKIKEVTSANLKVQLHTYNLELELYRDTRAHQTGIALISEIETFLQKFPKKIPDDYLLCFYYQFAYLHFKQQQYSTALQWLNKILKTKFDTPRQDLESYARFLHLIIHFEQGNIIVLRYAVESCRRFLKKNASKLNTFEKVLLRFFSKICTQPPDNYKELFIKLQEELFADNSPEERSQHLDYLDFETWMAENIQKKHFF